MTDTEIGYDAKVQYRRKGRRYCPPSAGLMGAAIPKVLYVYGWSGKTALAGRYSLILPILQGRKFSIMQPDDRSRYSLILPTLRGHTGTEEVGINAYQFCPFHYIQRIHWWMQRWSNNFRTKLNKKITLWIL